MGSAKIRLIGRPRCGDRTSARRQGKNGRKIRQIIPVRRLCEWAAVESGIAPWLFEECYEAVGDLPIFDERPK